MAESVRVASLLDFLEALASVSEPGSFAPTALRGLHGLVPADLWGFNDLDPHSREMVSAIWPPDGARPEHFEAVAKVVWEHPVLQAFQRTGDGSPTRISDLWSADRYKASALYREAYSHMGVEYQIAFSLSDGDTAATIGIAGNRRDRDFTDDEVALLASLRHPLRLTWQRVQAASALSSLAELDLDAIERAVLVDGSGIVTRVSERAAFALGAAGVDLVVDRPVPEPIRRWLRRGAGPRNALEMPHGGGTLRLYLVGGANDADRVLLVDANGALRTPTGSELTARQREVLRLVKEGRTDAEIAAALGISSRTVEKHLENAFAKLGVTNRTAAIRAAQL